MVSYVMNVMPYTVISLYIHHHHVQIRRFVDSNGTGSISFCFLHWVWSTSVLLCHRSTNFWPTQQLSGSMVLRWTARYTPWLHTHIHIRILLTHAQEVAYMQLYTVRKYPDLWTLVLCQYPDLWTLVLCQYPDLWTLVLCQYPDLWTLVLCQYPDLWTLVLCQSLLF